MNELRDLYQEVILDHNKRPRNFGSLPDATREADGYNPLCGDKVHVYVKLDDGRVDDVRFEGEGCAISTASASLMTEAIKGRTFDEIETLFRGFHELLTGDPSVAAKAGPELGKLAVMEGVRAYPMRVKCATLVWHTLQAALDERQAPVSTE
ncbi:MAG: Fe-S cluster assembly sulfur transfer protein SufU [Thermoanaerobaculia bacterium]